MYVCPIAKFVGGTFDIVSPIFKIVGGTCPPVPPWICAHGHGVILLENESFYPVKKKKKKKKKTVLLTMSLKLIIEVVAFFLGHPV